MNRRDFLKLSGLIALTTACQPWVASEKETGVAPTNIIIIGAGMAGIAAARTLLDAGHTVTILEARDRIGGRVFTSTGWPNIPLDLGASWIHGTTGNPLTTLADAANITRLPTHYNNGTTYATNGTKLTDTQVETLFENAKALFETALENANTDQTITDALEAASQWQALSVAEQRAFRHALNVTLEHEFSGSIAAMSAVNYDDSSAYPGDDVLFPGGYKQIIDHLAQGLTIERNQRVTEIDYSNDITIYTDQGQFTADQVIVTLPIGVLKQEAVAFTPTLPAEKLAAIDAMGSGLLDKLYLRFPTAFWETNLELIDWISAEPGRWNEWINIHHYVGEPILLGFNAADYAKKLSTWTDEAVVADAMDVLRTLYGADIPDPISWQRSNWYADPFAWGSYSFNAVDASSDTRELLGNTVADRLFFAGEATSKAYPATVHGAYLSGLRAARDLIRTL